MMAKVAERMKLAELMCFDPHSWLFSQIQDWPGAVDENLIRRYAGPHKGLVEQALEEMLQLELVQFGPVWRTSKNSFITDLAKLKKGDIEMDQVRMFYLAKMAGRHLHRRDQVAPNHPTSRHDSAMNQDRREVRPHLSHTGQLDDVVTSLMLQGFDIRSGRRDLVQPEGLPQLVPDAVLTTVVAGVPFSLVHLDATIDVEVSPGIKDRLFPVLNVQDGPDRYVVVLVCNTRRLATLAQAEADAWVRLLESRQRVLAVTAQDVSDMSAYRKLPDSLRGLFRVVRFFVEYERSARFRDRIRDKLVSYMELAKNGHVFPLLFITEKDQAEWFVLEESEALMAEHGVELMVVTSTYDRIVRRLPAGDPTVWSHRGGSIKVLPV